MNVKALQNKYSFEFLISDIFMADLNSFKYDFERQSWHLTETCVYLDSWELSRWPSCTSLDFSAV